MEILWGRCETPQENSRGTYRCGGIWASVSASLRLVDLCAAAGPAEVVPDTTSGKLFLKAA